MLNSSHKKKSINPVDTCCFLGSFLKLRRATNSFVTSVRPSEWNNSAPAGWIFMKFNIWRFFEKNWWENSSFIILLVFVKTCVFNERADGAKKICSGWRQYSYQYLIFILAFNWFIQSLLLILYTWVRASWNEFNNCPTICDLFSLLHFCRQLYIFRVLTPIIRSWYSCNCSFCYLLTAMSKIRCY